MILSNPATGSGMDVVLLDGTLMVRNEEQTGQALRVSAPLLTATARDAALGNSVTAQRIAASVSRGTANVNTPQTDSNTRVSAGQTALVYRSVAQPGGAYVVATADIGLAAVA